MIDRNGLATFLRGRRESLQPEDVGMPRGQRRRTSGLRREEVAVLCHMSTDYYARLERGNGPQPSEQMISAMAQGLHLSLDERDHLFHLAGHTPPTRNTISDHVSPGLLRILDRLDDTPAEIVTELGETLRQSRLGVALTGDLTQFTGLNRSLGYRWFTNPDTRKIYHPDDHSFLSRMYAAGLRGVLAHRGQQSRAGTYADALLAESEEFREVWEDYEIGIRPAETKRYIHPQVGELALNCQTLIDPEQSHYLLVYTAVPGTESYERLQLLSVVGEPAM